MRIPAALAAFLLLAVPGFAAPLSSPADLVREAEKNNPDLAALHQKAEASKARIPAASALPDPRVSLELMDVMQPGSPKIGASQMVMFPGKLGKMVQMEAQMAEMARQEFENHRWMVGSDVRSSYYDLYYYGRLQGINRESQQLLKDMIRVTSTRYAVGQGMQSDIVRPQLQLSKLMNDQMEYQERLTRVAARLNRLLGRSTNTVVGDPPASLSLTKVKLDRKALLAIAEQSPMLKMGRAEVGRAQAALELAKLGYMPDFEIGAGVSPGGGMNPSPTFSAMAGITVPLWAGQKQANQVLEAEKNLAAAKSRLEDTRRKQETEIVTLANQIERMEQQWRLLNDGMIPQSKLALRSGLAAYQSGKGDYLMLLDSFMALYDNRMQAAMLLSEHEKMIAMLEAQLGQSLKGA